MASPARAERIEALPEPARVDALPSKPAFWLILIFFVLEYARPPVIVQLRLQMLIVLMLPLLWLNARKRPWHSILTAQIAFVALCAIHVPFAWNNYAAYFVTRGMFANVVLAVGMSWVFSHRENLRWGIWTWLAIMAYVAAFGLTHGGTGPGGFLGDENDLALATVTALPFAFFGAEQLPGWKRWVCVGLGVLVVSAVVASFSRGGFVALAAVGIYCWIVTRHKLRNLAVLAVAAAAFMLLAPRSYLDEIRTITDTSEGTAETRQFLWETAYNIWLDHPVIGAGGGNFNYLAGRYQPTDWEGRDYQERSWAGTTVHSAYFQLLSEQGLVGIALAGFIGIAHLRGIRRLRRDVRRHPGAAPDLRRDVEFYGASLSAAMIGYAVAGAFLSVAYYPYLWYFSGLAVALDAAARRELARGEEGGRRPGAAA